MRHEAKILDFSPYSLAMGILHMQVMSVSAIFGHVYMLPRVCSDMEMHYLLAAPKTHIENDFCFQYKNTIQTLKIITPQMIKIIKA